MMDFNICLSYCMSSSYSCLLLSLGCKLTKKMWDEQTFNQIISIFLAIIGINMYLSSIKAK